MTTTTYTPDLQTMKRNLCEVDKWNKNTMFNVMTERVGRIGTYVHTNDSGNSFILSLVDQFLERGKLSEKQAYFLAKYYVENFNQIEK